MNDALLRISLRLPLRVESAVWQDPVLAVSGEGWSLSVLSAWRIVRDGTLIVGSDEAQPTDVSSLLDGNVVIDLRPHGSLDDPALGFESGHVLEVFSTGLLEPWVLHLGSGGAYVASPGG